MTAPIIVVIVLLILLAISLLRVGIFVRYDEGGAAVSVGVGPIKFKVYPFKKKHPKEKKAPQKAGEAEKKGGRFEKFRELLSPALEAAGKFKRKLRINHLRIEFTAAAEDPANAAMMFGYASSGLGILLPVLENNFDIRERELKTGISFDINSPVILIDAHLSIAVWQAVGISAVFLYKYLMIRRKTKKEKGGVKKDGKASN